MNLSELAWPDVDALSRDLPVVIPVAAVEQHGHHLPVFTDSMLLGEIVRRVNESMKDRVLFTPLMWFGNSHHHMDFPGTMSATPRVYLDLLNDLIENMLMHGFKRIVVLNGHGGNSVPGKQAVFEVRQRHRLRYDLLLLFATYWERGQPNQSRPDFVQDHMGHACEWETSMILKLAPHLVKDYQRAATVEFGNAFEPAARAWTTKDRTKWGHIGQPSVATAEKGEALFQTFSTGVTQLLEEVIAWDGSTWG